MVFYSRKGLYRGLLAGLDMSRKVDVVLLLGFLGSLLTAVKLGTDGYFGSSDLEVESVPNVKRKSEPVKERPNLTQSLNLAKGKVEDKVEEYFKVLKRDSLNLEDMGCYYLENNTYEVYSSLSLDTYAYPSGPDDIIENQALLIYKCQGFILGAEKELLFDDFVSKGREIKFNDGSGLVLRVDRILRDSRGHLDAIDLVIGKYEKR